MGQVSSAAQDASRAFFDQLAEFSRRWTEQIGAPSVSPWRYPTAWEGRKGPSGVILHYTADPDVVSVCRWFLQERWAAKVSAHVVIAPCWPEGSLRLASDLPLVSALPAMVVQCVPPSDCAWHATWANRWAYGIEMVNLGKLDLREGRLWGAGEKSYSPDYGVPLAGGWWAPYSEPQVRTAMEIVRLVAELGERNIRPTRVLGHEHISRVKRDPGPAFPLRAVRMWMDQDRVGAGREVLAWGSSALHEEVVRNRIVLDAMPGAALADAWRGWLTKVASGEEPVDTAAIVLGYEPEGGDWVSIFQRMMGVGVDGRVGPATRAALVERVREIVGISL